MSETIAGKTMLEERAERAYGPAGGLSAWEREEKERAVKRIMAAMRELIGYEREACALLLEKLAAGSGRFDRNIAEALKDAAREIRARGKL